jgi:hypothetical protein
MSDSDFMGFKARAAGHDNCYYRCAACGAFTHYSEAHACGAYAKPTPAATCKCGHVGAECFDDEYCATESEAATWERKHRELHQEYTLYREGMRAEIKAMKAAHKIAQYKQYEGTEFWRKAFEQRSSTATQVEITLQNRITELEKQFTELSHYHNESTLELLGEINDLQAEYAADHVVWCALENEGYSLERNYVVQLETTIKTLASMIE